MGLLSTIGAASGRAFGLTRVGAAIRDAYFNLTTLLLPGDGTNGAQNNTFLDSSSNNFTITRNGNTTQGTFSPFSQTGWGNFFGGTLSYFTAPSNAAFNMGAGDFTVELFAYDVARNSSGTIWVSKWGSPASVGRSFVLGYMSSTNELFLYGSSDGTTQTNIISTTSHGLNLNTWNHIAATRSGNTFRLFVNGSLVATATNSITLYSSTTPFCVGANYEDVQSSLSNFNVNGYISNLRILKGTAQYTSAFTPPVSPLTAITNTSLLTCQSNRFIDNSSNAFAITVNGTTSVQAFSPFAPTAAYSAATVGGSGYFDASGDYLSVAGSSLFAFGTGDFTLEVWINPNAISTATFDRVCATSDYNGSGFDWALNTGASALFLAGSSYGFSVNTKAWNHLVYTRSGTTLRGFLNGRLASYNTGVSQNITSTSTLLIGAGYSGALYNGYMTGLRIIKGSIPTEYQTSSTTTGTQIFTTPTAPPTTTSQGATANDVELLLNYTNAGITDATAKNDLETVGTAQISTAQKKWGSSSIYFDGVATPSDLLQMPKTNILLIGASDYTFECWMRPEDVTNLQAILSYGGSYWRLFINGSNFWFLNSSSTILNVAHNMSINNWYHVALVRKGSGTNNTALWVDGVRKGQVTNTTDFSDGDANIYIGAEGTGSLYKGYLQDVRLTKFARYDPANSTITVPTTAFPLQ